MTSDPSRPREAFVWIWLPGRTAPAVAGRIHAEDDHFVFTYGRSYLAREDAIPVYAPDLAEALQHGTAIGGARPKALIRDGDIKYVAKFSSSTDTFSVVKAEFIAMRLASIAGLSVAPVKLVRAMNKDVLLIRRFDREPAENGWTRRAMVSALTLLGLDERFAAHASYEALADIVRAGFTAPAETLRELFARMVFNILVGNTPGTMPPSGMAAVSRCCRSAASDSGTSSAGFRVWWRRPCPEPCRLLGWRQSHAYAGLRHLPAIENRAAGIAGHANPRTRAPQPAFAMSRRSQQVSSRGRARAGDRAGPGRRHRGKLGRGL